MTELQSEYDGTGKATLDRVLAAAKKHVGPSGLVDDPGRRPRQDREGVKALKVGDVVCSTPRGGRWPGDQELSPGSGVPEFRVRVTEDPE